MRCGVAIEASSGFNRDRASSRDAEAMAGDVRMCFQFRYSCMMLIGRCEIK